MSRIRAIVHEVVGLFVDDVAEAAAIVAVVLVTLVLSRTGHSVWLGVGLGLALCLVLIGFVTRDAHRRRR